MEAEIAQLQQEINQLKGLIQPGIIAQLEKALDNLRELEKKTRLEVERVVGKIPTEGEIEKILGEINFLAGVRNLVITSITISSPQVMNLMVVKTPSGRVVRQAGGGQGLRFLDRRERAHLVTWPDVLASAREVCGGLRALGVRPGERVGLIFATSPEFFAAFFGAVLAGAVPVPLYPPVRLGRIEEYHGRTATMLRAASARLVLAEGRVRRVLGETVRRAAPALGCLSLEKLPVGRAQPVRRAPEDLAMVQFSSGTTVAPKPVALSHRAVLTQARLILGAITAAWPEGRGLAHTGTCWLPLYHDMGLIGCVFPALLHPSTLTLLGPELFVARPASWLRAISRWGSTVSPAPNFAYALCADRIRDEQLDGVDLSSWRVAMNGAEPVAPETLRRFVRRFAKWGLRPEALTPVYGLSEAALAVSFAPLRRPFTSAHFDREALAGGRAVPSDDGVELVSLGEPLPGFELSIRDGDTALEGGRVGRLWIRGPSLMRGYLDRPEDTARVLRGDWLDTGDLGFVHRGALYLTGRAKDVLILRGRNYAPQEVEQAAEGLPGLRAGCAAAASWRPEGADREALALFVEHREDASAAQIEALPAAAAAAVLEATGLRCDLVLALPPGTLPRTSSGKIRRAETLRRHLEGDLRPPKRVTPIYLAGVLARSGLAWMRQP